MEFGNAVMGTETAEGKAVYAAALRKFRGEATPEPVAVEPVPEPEVNPMLASGRELLRQYIGHEAVDEIGTLELAADFIDTALRLYKLGDDTQRFMDWLAEWNRGKDQTTRAQALAEGATIEIAGFVPGALMARAEAIAAVEAAEETQVSKAQRIAQKAAGMSFAERVAYCREHQVPLASLRKVLRRFKGIKTRGYVPNHTIHYTKRTVDEESGEVETKTWKSRTITPSKWGAVKGLTFYLVADVVAS